MKNPLLGFLKKTLPSDVIALMEANRAEIEIERAKLAALRSALDEASLTGKGGATALAALREQEAAIELLEHRADALARAKDEADALAARQHIEALERAARKAAEDHDRAASAYDKAAMETARKARELNEAVERMRCANRSVQVAEGEMVGCALADHVAENLNLPASRWDAPAHHEAAPTINPHVVALSQMFREATEAGERKAAAYTDDLKAIVGGIRERYART